jgi:hypothetical protein
MDARTAVIWGVRIIGALVMLVLGFVVACQPEIPSGGQQPGISPDGPPAYRSGGETPWPGYWRPAWQHVAGTKCTTRGMVLQLNARPAPQDTDGDGCADDADVFDVYTGKTISPTLVQIDHVYPLRRAWNRAAHAWPKDRWVVFANWQPNLIPTALNERKGDAMPGEWTPPDRNGQCTYSIVMKHTAQEWNLPFTPSEEQALNNLSNMCRQE